jgi:site-specific recombinase XerC
MAKLKEELTPQFDSAQQTVLFGTKAPTVKQHLACIRMLFDWLVTGQVLPSNPAHAVRGPRLSIAVKS